MMDELIEIFKKIKPNASFTPSTDLIGEHILDSMSIALLVGELNENYDIDITPVDLVPENFRNLEAIMDLIQRLSDE